MDFGTRLKKIRQAKEISQEELAKMIQTSRSNIANYETGKNMPSLDILNKLSQALNVSTDYLLGNSSLDFELELAKIGLSTKDMNTISEETKAEIKNFVEYIINKEKK